MEWIDIKDKAPELGKRILTYSEGYSSGMAYRILNSEFVEICKEVIHWIYLEKPERD